VWGRRNTKDKYKQALWGAFYTKVKKMGQAGVNSTGRTHSQVCLIGKHNR
jgi:hypothetical protein